MWGHTWSFDWGSGWISMGIIGMLLFWVSILLIIVIIVALIRWLANLGKSSAHQAAQKTPLEILKERYARGEINREEFMQKKQDIAE